MRGGFCRSARRPESWTKRLRERLSDMAVTHADATRRLRAMWALHVTGGLPDDVVSAAASTTRTSTSAPGRFSSRSIATSRIWQSLLPQFVGDGESDPSPVVRLYLASALQRLPLERALGRSWQVLTQHAEDAERPQPAADVLVRGRAAGGGRSASGHWRSACRAARRCRWCASSCCGASAALDSPAALAALVAALDKSERRRRAAGDPAAASAGARRASGVSSRPPNGRPFIGKLWPIGRQ